MRRTLLVASAFAATLAGAHAQEAVRYQQCHDMLHDWTSAEMVLDGKQVTFAEWWGEPGLAKICGCIAARLPDDHVKWTNPEFAVSFIRCTNSIYKVK